MSLLKRTIEKTLHSRHGLFIHGASNEQTEPNLPIRYVARCCSCNGCRTNYQLKKISVCLTRRNPHGPRGRRVGLEPDVSKPLFIQE